MAHPSARLSVFSRQLLIKRVVVDGWATATVAEQLGISRATAYKWVRRYRAAGLPGLEDRSSRPHRSPRRSSDEATAAILSARARPALRPGSPGPADRPPALDDLRRPAPRRPQPLARHRPGDRGSGSLRGVPPGRARPPGPQEARPGAGRRWLAGPRPRVSRPRIARVRGYDHLEVFVDDASRYAVVVPVADERGESASWAVELAVAKFAEVGIRIERMLTDNGASYRSHAYRDVLERSRSATSGPGRSAPRPTARPNASSRPCSTSGPTPGPTGQTATGCTHSAASSTSTITDVRTPRSEASCLARLSTTSPNTTSSWRARRQSAARRHAQAPRGDVPRLDAAEPSADC